MMPQRIFRLPQELLDAAEAKAKDAGMKFSEYVRKLIEQDTGVATSEIKMGLAAADAKTRKRVQSAGVDGYVASMKARAKKTRKGSGKNGK